jgi:hypothetical protein
VTRVRTGFRFPAIIGAALLAGVFGTVVGVAPARADTRSEAREAYSRGKEAYRVGNYESAREAFKEANDLVPAPQAQFWLAMSLDQLDRDTEALAAFERLIADPSFEKIGDDLVAVALGRREVLAANVGDEEDEEEVGKEYWDPESGVPPEEDAEAEGDEGADEVADQEEAAEVDDWNQQLLPEAGIFEVGIFTGPMRISRAHNLVEPPNFRRGYVNPSWMIGGRVGYSFIPNLAAEMELGHAESKVDRVDRRAHFFTFRTHLLAQLSTSRVAPYVVAGIGGLKTSSDPMGKDVDFLGYLGAGAKVPVIEPLTLRLDYRLDMTDHIEDLWSFHHEFLLGLSYTLRTQG